MIENNKVVVIGGSGFLGSHIADSLSESGYAVTVFDTCKSASLREDQNMLIGDILDLQNVTQALKNAKYVYHLAGIADIDKAATNPRKTIIQNIIGSTNVIEASLACNVEKLIFASTVYVYSDKGSFYRVSKQAVEILLENYRKELELNYTIIRYGSLYGPRSQDWNGLKRFVTQAVRDKKIVYPGLGNEQREYIHVKDAAHLSVQVLDDKYDHQCLTLTGTQVMSTKKVLTMIAEILNDNIEIEFAPEGSSYDLFHYQMTPYRYTPKSGRKLITNCFFDLGQGILDMIEEVHLNDLKKEE